LSLKHSYTLISPFYDLVLAAASRGQRADSLAALPQAPARVLLSGVGTGLDLPLLPLQHRYTGIDLTPAMLRRARRRAGHLDFQWIQGDSQRLPFADRSFDHAVLHLILAVLPDPVACLRETARVLAAGGSVLIFDKFLQPGQWAPVRRLVNPMVRHVATRLDVVFEEVLAQVPGLVVASDQPALAGGWFRRIRLQRV
jgi:phosphatidylethanolamine/phosphatidyl-N-methylethanolamine N-methyltransferase